MKRNLVAALALSAVAAVGAPGIASASTTAGATILNVVKVEYKDVTNTNSFSAASSTTVTVNLVKAALSITTAPTVANYAPLFSCADLGSYASGDTFSAVYALTAAANGQDNYQLSISHTGNSATNTGATYSILNANGTVQVPAATASSKILNSAIVVGTRNSDILQFPGGSLATADGFAAGDIVLVNYGATRTAYLVKDVKPGKAAGFDIATGDATAEERAEIQVEAWTNNSLGIGSGGTAPDFANAAPAVGTVVGQMALVRVDVTARSNVSGVNATVDYQLRATDSAGNNEQFIGTGGTNTCRAGNFLATQLQILKQVKNLDKGGDFAATATSDPQDVLEYLVTVTNEGGQANSAAVIDIIPSYTKLVTFDGTYGGTENAAGSYFAQVSDGTNTVDLTVASDDEAQPAAPAPAVGFGKASGTAAGQTLNFYLGEGSSKTNGGTVPSCSDRTTNTQALCEASGASWKRTYTIKYRVKVD